jgi:hypothetical protein
MLTPSVVTQAGPVLLETAIKHYLLKKKVTKDTQARKDFMYDEGEPEIPAFGLDVGEKAGLVAGHDADTALL